MGTLHPRLDRVLPPPSPDLRWGTPPAHPGLDGVPPPVQDWMDSPLLPPPVRRQISKASTCYAAGGVPLAGLPRHRENREFESPFFETGKTQGIC